MKNLIVIVLFLLGYTFAKADNQKTYPDSMITLTEEECKLYELVKQYRKENKLPDIPLSKSLTVVAKTHAWDLNTNRPLSTTCNMHSWSDKGSWTPCCYTSDHKQAGCMWAKPKELTEYKGNGYEISASTSFGNISPQTALSSWKGSEGHNNVILNKSYWNRDWKAIGIGMNGNFAVIWFGHDTDPETPKFATDKKK